MTRIFCFQFFGWIYIKKLSLHVRKRFKKSPQKLKRMNIATKYTFIHKMQANKVEMYGSSKSCEEWKLIQIY